MSSSMPHRQIDRSRRQRILDATLAVIGEFGVEGLTHRRVADAAGVPSSAPSYYFDSIEDLLEAALIEAAENEMIAFRRRIEALCSAEELPTVLASYIIDGVRDDPSGIVILGELYVAALRRTRLREVVNAWDAMWLDVLTPIVGRQAALATTLISGALSQRALRLGASVDVSEIEQLFRTTAGLAR